MRPSGVSRNSIWQNRCRRAISSAYSASKSLGVRPRLAEIWRIVAQVPLGSLTRSQRRGFRAHVCKVSILHNLSTCPCRLPHFSQTKTDQAEPARPAFTEHATRNTSWLSRFTFYALRRSSHPKPSASTPTHRNLVTYPAYLTSLITYAEAFGERKVEFHYGGAPAQSRRFWRTAGGNRKTGRARSGKRRRPFR